MLQYKIQVLKKETLFYYPAISTCLPVHFFRGSDERTFHHALPFFATRGSIVARKKGSVSKSRCNNFSGGNIQITTNGCVRINPAMYTI